MWIKDMIGRVVNKLFPKTGIEKALGLRIAVSDKMRNAIQLWGDMYTDQPYWKNDKCKTMNLPAAIAHEFSRLITLENEFVVTGSPFADYINEQLHASLKNFKNVVELYCAKGGIAMKPYVNGKKIEVDFTQAENFYPIEYDNNGISGAVFVDVYRTKKFIYTRLEIHQFRTNQTVIDENGNARVTNTYTVENRAYKSEPIHDYLSDDELVGVTAREPFKQEVLLSEVSKWASLSPKEVIYDVEKPLFVYVRVPAANNVDTQSPLGASVYAKAVDAIMDADQQYSQTKFEFEAFEAAIDAEADLFKKEKDGTLKLPTGKERVFRTYDTRSDGTGQPLLREFAPDFRDSSLFNGLDHYLKIVEFLCELTYGTISDPVNLAGKVKSPDALALERMTELGRRKIVVLDSISRTEYLSLFKSFDSMKRGGLNRHRKRRGETLKVILIGIPPFGFEKQKMLVLVRESFKFILDARAVARAYAVDLSGEKRRILEPLLKLGMDIRIGMNHIATHLPDIRLNRRGNVQKGEPCGRLIAVLDRNGIEIYRLRIYSRRSAGLHPPAFESGTEERFGNTRSSRLTHPSASCRLLSYEHPSVKKCSGGHNHLFRGKTCSELRPDSGHSIGFCYNYLIYRVLPDIKVRGMLKYITPVQNKILPVALGTRAPDRRAL